jgi:hypothetical protein
MATVNRLIGWLSAGALLGLMAASLLAPSYLGWDNTAASGTALCECSKVTRDTASRLLGMQAESAAIGGVLFLIVGIALVVRARNKAAPA